MAMETGLAWRALLWFRMTKDFILDMVKPFRV